MSNEANPKQQYGDKKIPLQFIPPVAIAYMGIGLGEGAKKYGAYNFRDTSVEYMTYIGATLRHVLAMLDGEDIDPDSGNPHAAHAMASLAILVDQQTRGTITDNRPAKGEIGRVLKEYENERS